MKTSHFRDEMETWWTDTQQTDRETDRQTERHIHVQYTQFELIRVWN